MSHTDLAQTPLYDLHQRLGAKLVPFAGYAMPVQYPMGIMTEHRHTREQAGLFDVSHMGQIRIHGDTAAHSLERLVPANVVDLKTGRQRYALFTDEQGGILDDLMIANAGDHLFLVVNAACKHDDLARLHSGLPDCRVEYLDDRALLALQGPEAATVLARLAPEAATMSFMDARPMNIHGLPCWVSRSGYTGEDGYEISVANDNAETLAAALLAQPEVAPVGLGARDSLRLEAGLCLYGHDLSPEITPVEANLAWSIGKARRPEGKRSGGFPGTEIIFQQLAGGVLHQRVGLAPEGRAPVREGAILTDGDDVEVGRVTSGSFGPTVNQPVAMGYVATPHAVSGTGLFAQVRGKALPVKVADLPFVTQRYRR